MERLKLKMTQQAEEIGRLTAENAQMTALQVCIYVYLNNSAILWPWSHYTVEPIVNYKHIGTRHCIGVVLSSEVPYVLPASCVI